MSTHPSPETKTLPFSFDDTQIAFKLKSDAELKKAHLLFRFFGFKWLIAAGPILTSAAFALRLPIKPLIKNTIFAQFCGGENIDECKHASDQLWKQHVSTILDYSVEGAEEEAVFDQTATEIIKTIDKAAESENISFSVFKVTGIGRFALLEKLNFSRPLTPDEVAEKQRVEARFDKICAHAYEKGVRLLVDAEETWIQEAIDRMTMDAMCKYNKERAIIYNTLQLYRHDRVEFLKRSIANAIGHDCHAGFKLVRGAYMEKERKRAQEKGYLSPIQPDKESADKDYNAALKICMEHIDRVSICAGTHNEESCYYLARLMEANEIAPSDERIYFSQLLGMSDHISFNLSNAGYNVAKYVPYGPVKAVLPYLTRRAQENSSVAGQAGRELTLIERELKRRKLN
ncbi:MAG: proline dehydrogenase [Bacteroidetes bacterium]|nr:MAG: proline dehydrogenase [Bacteroidota bacterium]